MSLTRTILRAGAALLLVVAGAACASAGGGNSSTGGNRSVLSSEELRVEVGRNLADVIRQLRPQWLVKRGATSFNNEGDIVVYQDGTRLGGPEVLRTIPTDAVESVRLLGAGEATTRFGTGHTHGAIVIVSRR